MIKKPMMVEEFFNKICDNLKEKGKWPAILDYASGNRWENIRIKTDEFELKNNLDYGGSEGIYLDIALSVYDKENEEERVVKLGTFKTLDTNDEAMHTMAALLADFILEDHEYVREHRSDFNWKGVCLYPADENGKKYGWGRYCYNEADVEKLKDEFLQKYSKVIIENYETREEMICEQERENTEDLER